MTVFDFKKTRRLKTFNFWTQLGLMVSFLLCANYVGSHFFKRGSSLMEGGYTLSAATLGYLKTLKAPVQIIATLVGDSGNIGAEHALRDVGHLLREYEYASLENPAGLIVTEFLNPFYNKRRAQELASQYQLTKENTILVIHQGRSKELILSDLYEAKKGQIQSFKGEEAITEAIINLSQSKRKKIYFTRGHGEMSPESVHPLQGISDLAQMLQFQNYEWELLDLTESLQVPSDADLVIIPGPQIPFLPYEGQQLSQYLEAKNGRVVVLLSPTKPHGLENLFYKWGIQADNKIIVDTGSDFHSTNGEFLIRRFSTHPITKQLIDYQLGLVWGLMCPVLVDIGAPRSLGLQTQSLLASSQSSWTKYMQEGLVDFEYNPDTDLKGPISLAAVSERKIDTLGSIHISSGKLVVVGNADCISNQKLGKLGNRTFILNTIHWMVEREYFLDIIPRSIKSVHLVLTNSQMQVLGLQFFIPALLVSLFGFFVWYKRRH